MKKLTLTIATLIPLIFGMQTSANAYTWGSLTPNYGGGYTFQEWGPSGYTYGNINRSYGGGYNWSFF
tara:strand:- start:12042 stop:12242 length:201 start_codon:yes stop_codon:yes gene_type:complete